MALDIRIAEREGKVLVISLVGSIDSTTYLSMDERLAPAIAASPRIVVLDMAGVTYISSAGLGVIFKTRKALEKAGGKLFLVHLLPRVKKIFDIIKALPPEAVFRSADEMDAYLAEMQRKI